MSDTHKVDYTHLLTEEEIAIARSMTDGEILIEGVKQMIRISVEGGLSELEAENIIQEFLSDNARSRFKVIDSKNLD